MEDIAGFEGEDDDCSGFVLSLAVSAAGAVSDIAEDWETGGKEEMGDVVGIETSLRGPCEPAPVAVLPEGSSLSSSTSGRLRIFEGGCALGKALLAVEAWPAPVVSGAPSAIGRGVLGV